MPLPLDDESDGELEPAAGSARGCFWGSADWSCVACDVGGDDGDMAEMENARVCGADDVARAVRNESGRRAAASVAGLTIDHSHTHSSLCDFFC